MTLAIYMSISVFSQVAEENPHSGLHARPSSAYSLTLSTLSSSNLDLHACPTCVLLKASVCSLKAGGCTLKQKCTCTHA